MSFLSRGARGGRATGVAAMVLASVLFSLMSVLIGMAHGISSFLTSFARFAVGAVVVGTLALVGRIRLDFVNRRLLVLRGLLGGVAVYTFFLAIDVLGVARGSVISHTYPLFAAVGGALFLKERVTPVAWAALALTLVGLGLLRLGDWLASPTWDPWYLVATVGAVLSGLAVVAVRKLTETDSSPVIFLAQSLVGFWLVFVPALGAPSPLTVPVAFLLLGIGLSAAVAQLLMTWSYRSVDVATGSLLSVLTPVLNVVFGVLLFREGLGPLQAVGVGLIIASCVLIVVPWRRARPAAA